MNVVIETEDCPICYEVLSSNKNYCKTACGHSFCFSCIITSITIAKNRGCPICRQVIAIASPPLPSVARVAPAAAPANARYVQRVVARVVARVVPPPPAVVVWDEMEYEEEMRDFLENLTEEERYVIRINEEDATDERINYLKLTKNTKFNTLYYIEPHVRNRYFTKFPDRLVRYNRFVEKRTMTVAAVAVA